MKKRTHYTVQLTSSWLLLSTPDHLKHASATNFLLVHPKMTVTNGLTVDAEDYFHVYTYSDVICRENWDVCEQTVERNTYRLLDIFDSVEFQISEVRSMKSTIFAFPHNL